MTETAYTRDDFRAVAHTFAATLTPNPKHATVVALHGDLGAGKTTFVQDVAAVLGVDEHVTSPTFVIQKAYSLPEGQQFKQLIHIDAYRLEGAADMRPLSWEDTVSDAANLVFVEWAERIKEVLPEDAIHIQFSLTGEDERTIFYGKA